MKHSKLSLFLLASAFCSAPAMAQFSISPLSTFGGGDGLLAPGENGYQYLTTANTERGLDYNPVTGNLVLVSRAPVSGSSINIRVLNGATGADLFGLIRLVSAVALSRSIK